MLALYILFLLHLFYCPVVPTIDVDAPVIDYVVDDRTPTIELLGKQSHFPSPTYRLLSVFICCTRHMLLLRYIPIQMHSLSLSSLVVPFLYPMQPVIYINIIQQLALRFASQLGLDSGP